MDARVEPQPFAVDGVAAVDGGEEVVGLPRAVEGLVDLDVSGWNRVLTADELSRQLLQVLRVVDVARAWPSVFPKIAIWTSVSLASSRVAASASPHSSAMCFRM
jgi:hypothetical protein